MNNFAFFGTSRFSVIILNELKNKFNIIPSLLVTQPDKPVGRKQIITPPEAKIWAMENGIKIYQPEKLKSDDAKDQLKQFDFFVVASFGRIIPNEILNLPPRGAINIHPSLLPRYRGASPIQSQILNDEKNIGTSIMLMDEEVDHGPILVQKKVNVEPLLSYEELEEILAKENANILAEVLPKHLRGDIEPKIQDHKNATFTKMISKEDGLIKLEDDSEMNYRKYLAYHHWPKVFFFKDGKRNIITEAKLEDGKFKIIKVVPEGKRETTYFQ